MRWSALVLAVAAALALPGGARAQAAPTEASLESFVQAVARHWGAGDSQALVDLLPGSDRIQLDAGTGSETVNGRHAAAALRALFGERDGVSVRPARATVSGGAPPRGFGELAWTFRSRGSPSTQAQSVYVGAVWEDGRWRIAELRIMP